jgi:hypothetical protein
VRRSSSPGARRAEGPAAQGRGARRGRLPEDLRLTYANLVVAMADDDLLRAEEGFRYAQLQAMLYSTVYIYLNS